MTPGKDGEKVTRDSGLSLVPWFLFLQKLSFV